MSMEEQDTYKGSTIGKPTCPLTSYDCLCPDYCKHKQMSFEGATAYINTGWNYNSVTHGHYYLFE